MVCWPGCAGGSCAGSSLSGLALLMPTPARPGEQVPPGDELLVFEVGDEDGRSDLALVRPDGSDLTTLTVTPWSERQPRWSPDGTTIAFAGDRDGNPDIFLIGADGSGLRQLTRRPSLETDPAWAPDGTRIAFTTTRDGNAEIYTVSADGDDVRRLTRHPAADSAPAWSPGGTQLAFQTRRYGDDDVAVMNADGSGVRRVTTRSGADRNPDWRGHRAARYQPDLAIADSGLREFVGDATYGPGQTLSTLIAPGRSKTFSVRVTNDGDAADSFSIQGSAGGAGARVAYRAQGRDVRRPSRRGRTPSRASRPGRAARSS